MDSNQDQRIGENVAAYRRGRSQEWLADQMRERGHDKWSQSTVWSVEKGKRPIRFSEASDLVEILRIPLLEDLLRTGAETELAREEFALQESGRRLREAAADFAGRFDRYDRLLFAIESGDKRFLTNGRGTDRVEFEDFVRVRNSRTFRRAEVALAAEVQQAAASRDLEEIWALTGLDAARPSANSDSNASVAALAEQLARRRYDRVVKRLSHANLPFGRYECRNGHWRLFVSDAEKPLPEVIPCRTCDDPAKLEVDLTPTPADG